MQHCETTTMWCIVQHISCTAACLSVMRLFHTVSFQHISGSSCCCSMLRPVACLDLLQVTDEDVRAIEELGKQGGLFDRLAASIAPEIYGMLEVKKVGWLWSKNRCISMLCCLS